MLTSRQAAAYLGLTKGQLLYRIYIKRELQPAARVGRHFLFDPAHLDAWKAVQTRPPWKQGEVRWWLRHSKQREEFVP